MVGYLLSPLALMRAIVLAEWVTVLGLTACAHSTSAPAAGRTDAPNAETPDAALASKSNRVAAASPGALTTTSGTLQNQDHPLRGAILRTTDGTRIGTQELTQVLLAATVVLLGEKHDNPDHHLLQAQLYRSLLTSGPAPGLVLEMLDADQQGVVDEWRAQPNATPSELAKAVAWSETGWPAFSLYEPVFAAVLAGDGPVVAAGLPRTSAMPLARGQALSAVGVFAADLSQRYALDQALPPPEQAALRHEMQASHCGLLPDAMLDGMVHVQRVRDALLAEGLRLIATARPQRRAVLIAGSGHVRKDRGVPLLLSHAAISGVVAIGFEEVREEARDPRDYLLDAAAAFDYVILTATTPNIDHCAKLREHFDNDSKQKQ